MDVTRPGMWFEDKELMLGILLEERSSRWIAQMMLGQYRRPLVAPTSPQSNGVRCNVVVIAVKMGFTASPACRRVNGSRQASGKVVKHIEAWDVEPGKVVRQLLKPSSRVPPTNGKPPSRL